MAETCKKLKDENKELVIKLKELEEIKHDYEGKLASFPLLQERLNALEKHSRPVIVSSF